MKNKNFIDAIIKYLVKINKRPLIIGIDGGTSSGKTYFFKKILKELNKLSVDYYAFEIDDYSIDREKRVYPNKKYFNMKEWYDINLIAKHIKKIRIGKCALLMNTYNHSTGKKGKKKKIYFNGRQIVFLNGIYALDKRIRKYLDLGILLESTPEVRLKREIYRNVNKRYQNRNFVIERFKEAEEPTYQKHYKEIKKYVDIIIDNNNWRNPRITQLKKLGKSKTK